MIGSSGISTFGVIGSAVRTELHARTMQQALGSTGALSPAVDQAYQTLERDAREMAVNTAEAIPSELAGQLLDVIG